MRNYRIRIVADRFDTHEDLSAAKEAIEGVVCWLGVPEEDVYESRDDVDGEPFLRLEIEGRTQLGGGKTAQEASVEIRDDVWRATSGFVPLEVLWWDDEKEPDEHEMYDEEDYEGWAPTEDPEEKPKVSDDHVVIDASVQPPVFRCMHCNGEEGVGLPLSVSTLAVRSAAFTKKHVGCKKPEEKE